VSDIAVSDHIDGTVLVSRSSAEVLKRLIANHLLVQPGAIDFDFRGVRVLAPSFLDQLVLVIERIVAESNGRRTLTIILRNCPEGMNEKIGAIARAHDAEVACGENGEWIMSLSG
jgi:hypothetical protein